MKTVIRLFTRACEAWLPDAFVFCLILTLVVFLAGLTLTPHSSLGLLEFWGKDFWSLNAFAMQMVFVLLGGHLLATTPLVQNLITRLTSVIRTEKAALITIAVFSVAASWLNWGFGLIVSGILAVNLARKLEKVNYGLFIATAYSGFVVWHGGLSGSVPLKIAGKDEILSRVFPDLSIPLSETIFTGWNLLIVILIGIALPATSLLMRTEEKILVPQEENPIEEPKTDNDTFAGKLENSRWIVALFFVAFLVVTLRGGDFDINRLNFIFLFLALALHQTPAGFLRALHKSIGFTSGIVIQFPFYAGIMGLMQYSGLATMLSDLFVEISTEKTLPLFTFISAGVVNFFVPSGGGQWVVQGPVMMKAAEIVNVSPAKIAMALAWGDAWTNLIQPFWALPLLGLARLSLKDIMGYCLIYLLVTGVIICSVLCLI